MARYPILKMELPVTARPAQITSEPEPVVRFLTTLDRRLGPTAPALSTWPATVFYWKTALVGLLRAARVTAARADVRPGAAE